MGIPHLSVVAAGFILAASSAMPAWAFVWTATENVSISAVDPGWLTFSIPGFDPAAGPIVSADITLDGMLQASVFVEHGTTAMTGMFDNAVQVSPMATSVALGSMRASQTGPSTLSESVPVRLTSALPPEYVQTAQPGALDIDLFFLTNLAATGGVPQAQTLRFTGRVSATVTYADPMPLALFTSISAAAPADIPATIPEPTSAGLLGAGLLAAGLWLRRWTRRRD